MAYIETWVNQEMTKPVKVNYLGGTLFSQDVQGNLIGVRLTKNGEAYADGGTVSGNVIRADGGTVAITGSISGNKAQIILPAAAYAVVGAVTIIIKLTQNGQTATIGAFVGMVYASSTDTIVDPGTIIPSIADLIAQIQAAVGSIPADYSALNQEVNDLKSAIDNIDGVEILEFVKGYYIITDTNPVDLTPIVSQSGFGYIIANCTAGDIFTVNGEGGTGSAANVRLWCFVDENNGYLERAVAGASGDMLRIVAPANAAKLIINSRGDDSFAIKGDLVGRRLSEIEEETNRYAVSQSQLSTLTRFEAKNEDAVIVETADGTNFSVTQIEFLNRSGERTAIWNLASNKTNRRKLSISLSNGDCYQFRLLNGTAQNVIVTNASVMTAALLQKAADVVSEIYCITKYPLTENDIPWFPWSLDTNFTRYVNASNRIVTPILKVRKGTKISVDTNYKFRVITYSSNFLYLLQDSGSWKTSPIYIGEDSFIVILAGKSDDSNIDDYVSTQKKIHIGFPEYSYGGKKFTPFTMSFVDYCSLYKSPVLSTPQSIESMTVSDLYTLYDGIVSIDSNRFTRETLGYASKADGTQDTSLPIYAYSFNARNKSLYDSRAEVNPFPTVLILCGIHAGTEKSPAISMYTAFINAFNGLDEQLSDMFSCFNFKIVPCANPWGYNNGSRMNARGVNLGRNFVPYWTESEVGSDGYGGTEAASELETQAIISFLNANSDSLLLVDYHNCFATNEYAYFVDTDVMSNYVLAALSRRMTEMWNIKHNLQINDKLFIRKDRGVTAQATEQAGLTNIKYRNLIEINAYGFNSTHNDSTKYQHDCIESGIELFVNLLKATVAFEMAK